MNLNNIIQEIENKVDPEVQDKMSSRRSVLQGLGDIGGKLALAAVPLALGSFFNKSYGQTSNTTAVLEILNYALLLEYLEAEFYTSALVASTITFPTDASKNAITKIKNDEVAHVKFLVDTITQVGGAAAVRVKPTFKFTNNGTFGNVFVDYATFLAVAQAFEDTGVRAYKGRAKELVKGGAYLTAALNIHSVEARHAAHIRLMRKNAGASQKPWITLNDRGGLPAGTQAVYDGEEITTQATVNIAALGLVGVTGGGTVGANAASEAFDEPLGVPTVTAIASLFL